MKIIPITKGYSVTVDDEDFEFLSQWKWHAFPGASGKVYAARNSLPNFEGKRTHIFMHRVIANTPSDMDTDHRDGDGLNNRRKNLRTATRAQNMWNRAPNKCGTSRHKGVSWHKQHGKWIANIQVNKKRHFIGLFRDEDEAAKAYAERAAIEFGTFDWKASK